MIVLIYKIIRSKLSASLDLTWPGLEFRGFTSPAGEPSDRLMELVPKLLNCQFRKLLIPLLLRNSPDPTGTSDPVLYSLTVP